MTKLPPEMWNNLLWRLFRPAVTSADLVGDVSSNSYPSTTNGTFEQDVSLSYISAPSFMQWK